ncbi:hypothetical protein [Pseudanabaena sp. UWO311]|uniref:hypothetical protein n=1 Tax=Pseudanabaena sp. UWO311 TaxID=2487337 RepID=UPI0016816B28|nr:hypothetical protein [Pseudanabaena sp. UWO311]
MDLDKNPLTELRRSQFRALGLTIGLRDTTKLARSIPKFRKAISSDRMQLTWQFPNRISRLPQLHQTHGLGLQRSQTELSITMHPPDPDMRI